MLYWDFLLMTKKMEKYWYVANLGRNVNICETKVWLILILMIIKQGLELMIIFQVWLGKTISKVVITKTNHANEKSWRRRPPQIEEFFKTQIS